MHSLDPACEELESEDQAEQAQAKEANRWVGSHEQVLNVLTT
jgi:hypothetical protein